MRGVVAGLTFVVRVGAQLRRSAARSAEIDVSASSIWFVLEVSSKKRKDVRLFDASAD